MDARRAGRMARPRRFRSAAGRVAVISVRAATALGGFAGASSPLSHSAHPLLGERIEVAGLADLSVWQNSLSTARLPWLGDHQVHGLTIVPLTGFLEMMAAAGGGCSPGPRSASPTSSSTSRCASNRVPHRHPGRRPVGANRHLQQARRGMGAARVGPRRRGARRRAGGRPRRHSRPADGRCGGRGLLRGPRAPRSPLWPVFRGLNRLSAADNQAVALVAAPASIGGDLAGYGIHPALLDAREKRSQRRCTPTTTRRLCRWRSPGSSRPDRCAGQCGCTRRSRARR